MLAALTSAECLTAHHAIPANGQEVSPIASGPALLQPKSILFSASSVQCRRAKCQTSCHQSSSSLNSCNRHSLVLKDSGSERLSLGRRKTCPPNGLRTGPTTQVQRNPRLMAAAASAVAREAAPGSESATVPASGANVAVLINGGSGKMGQSVAQAALQAGLRLVPLALAGPEVPQHQVEIEGVRVDVYGGEHRDEILDKALAQHPDLIVVDYTLPAAVNDNAEWYCRRGVPFVMGTTGGDRQKLLATVRESGNYAVIAAQMGKQVVAFIAAMEALAEACPGAFTGYSLQVVESHQSSKVDTSGTAKEVVAAFQKLGVRFAVDEIEMVRDPTEQVARMKVPKEHLRGHAFHTYRLVSPDGTVSFEFQHNVCGRSIYAEGTVDAVLFLAKKISEGSEKKLYNMVDVLRGGAMR